MGKGQKKRSPSLALPPPESHWEAFNAVLDGLLRGTKDQWLPANRLLRKVLTRFTLTGFSARMGTTNLSS